MTLATCKLLLEHYNRLAEGVGISENNKHKNLVMEQAKLNAEIMKNRIEKKKQHPKYNSLEVVENKVEEKQNAKKRK